MDWTKIIQETLDSGKTQAEIAAACGTSQGYISGLLNGDRKNPGYDLGDALVKFHRRVKSRQKRKKTRAT